MVDDLQIYLLCVDTRRVGLLVRSRALHTLGLYEIPRESSNLEFNPSYEPKSIVNCSFVDFGN